MNTGLWIALWIVALAVLVYTYFGYPILMLLLARWRARPVQRERTPQRSITVILAVHNEQHTIEAKIHNIVALDYPASMLEVVVVDDGSSDDTLKVLESVQAHYLDREIHVVALPEAGGKAVALVHGVERSTGELLLFCDARQRIESSAALELAAVFDDPSVGAASGELELDSAEGAGLYWRYERAIRKAEGQVDSVIGVTGALYMIRRDVYQPFPANIILDDVWQPMQIALQGFRVLFIPEAKVYDQEAELDREFQRKTRTLAGNFQLMATMPKLLFPWTNRLFFAFFSHKVMRLLCPYALALAWVSNLILLQSPSFTWFWWLSFVGQSLFYGLAGLALTTSKDWGRVARVAGTFVVLNWAAVVGLFRFLRRDFRWTR
ncbi:MAG: glycosyltransferase [Deltaproteobacteria bacterium]|nr:MAG: glycosyltransferase [Deltaproteobacteria bacterium]